MKGTTQDLYDQLLRSGAQRLASVQRRLFQAEVCLTLCDGNPRQAEYHFGWGRQTVEKGLHELQSGLHCLENFEARGRYRSEVKNPQLAADIRTIVEPRSHADPELKSTRRYSHVTAAEVLVILQTSHGYRAEDLPAARTMRNILNRMNYRLKRIQKGKPLKKTKETSAVFANVQAVRAEYQGDPSTLQISIDTKAKVDEGDYARGGKNPDRRGRSGREGLGSRSARGAEMDAVGHLDVGGGSVDDHLRPEGDE
jgi:hypothetical protein